MIIILTFFSLHPTFLHCILLTKLKKKVLFEHDCKAFFYDKKHRKTAILKENKIEIYNRFF